MIPKIRTAIANYKLRSQGDYRAWPGPNSNTFVTAVLAAVPELRSTLPPTAIGKDFPYDDRWIGLTPSRTGIRLSLDGYLGFTAGWVEGFEINFLGAVFGIDLRRPAIKLPGLGRIGLALMSDGVGLANSRTRKRPAACPPLASEIVGWWARRKSAFAHPTALAEMRSQIGHPLTKL